MTLKSLLFHIGCGWLEPPEASDARLWGFRREGAPEEGGGVQEGWEYLNRRGEGKQAYWRGKAKGRIEHAEHGVCVWGQEWGLGVGEEVG